MVASSRENRVTFPDEADDQLGYDDLVIEHCPGEGFQWIFQMTEDGVLKGHAHEDKLEICPGL